MGIQLATEPDLNTAQYRVQSAFDALHLLEVLANAQSPLNATEISTMIGQHRNRVFRLLRTLEEAGYVIQDQSSRAYRPTLKLVGVGIAVSRNTGFESTILPVMERLQRSTDATVYLAQREGNHAIGIMSIERDKTRRLAIRPGWKWQLGRGAAGQALLITHPDREEFLLRHPEVARDYNVALEQLEQDQVIFVDGRVDESVSEDVTAIAAPVRESANYSSLALGIVWQIGNTSAQYEMFRHELLMAVARIEQEFAG